MAAVISPKSPLWEPQDIDGANIEKFRRFVNQKGGRQIRDTRELHEWSISPTTSEEFWLDLFKFLDIKSDRPPTRAFDRKSARSMFPPPAFFPDAKMNFAENIFHDREGGEVALYLCAEGGANLRKVTWDEIRTEVNKAANALDALGVKVGDRVAAVISNCLEALILCLASTSRGAIWSSISPDLGALGICDRLLSIHPTIVFSETSVTYNGKLIPLGESNAEWIDKVACLPEFRKAVILPRNGDNASSYGSKTFMTWDTFMNIRTDGELSFLQLPFNHPAFIVYSSGTTGPPKCIVHSGMGMLLQVKKDSMLHGNLSKGDVSFQYTTTGWIMWGMVICALGAGARVVVYDGSPYYPNKTTLLDVCSRLKVTMFGTSARYLNDLKVSEIRPRDTFDLSHLKTVTSTGSVLTADVATWFYQEGFPKNVHLISMSGGTDSACTLVHGNSTLPLWPGEIQGPSLGMAVDILDSDKAEAVSVAGEGRPGELVCAGPFPSEPVLFWGPKGMDKYKSSYFERFGTGIWCQGDFAQIVPGTKGILMLGRSDGTLNPSGIRFGSAEIYQIVDRMELFEDTICVGQRRPTDDDERVILFVKMKPGLHLTSKVRKHVKNEIQKARSRRHVPSHIFEVPEIPYTTNGKKIELAVKRIISGIPNPPSSAVANPDSLKFYERYMDLEQQAKKQDRQEGLLSRL